MWKLLLVTAFFLAKGDANDCVPRSFGRDSIVCVCNATYCDATPDSIPQDGSFLWYVSSKEGLRMNMMTQQFSSCEKTRETLTIDRSKRYQKILGFGTAFTDSAGINIKKLSADAQDRLIRAYYDPKLGSGYTLGRVPIGGSDFSTRPYTYDDTDNDTTLKYFSLAEEDYEYKIPFLKKAKELNPDTMFLSATWSPPAWMKTNDKINGIGFLKKEYYQVYADYILKFLHQYKSNGIDIWAVSTGNEPLTNFIPFNPLNTMGWTPGTLADWVENNLGPTLASSKFNDTLILALDDNRIALPWFIKRMFSNKEAKGYIAGIALHWYADFLIPALVVDKIHDQFPEKFLLMTEACTRGVLFSKAVELGSWERGEKYVLSIIEYMRHWSVGWVDWNMALNEEGGPTWIKNYVDSPIIVNGKANEFYKQPMYYALKHFSRFVGRGSIRISITDTSDIKSTAFETPSNDTVIVLYNRASTARNVNVKDPEKGSLCLELHPHSVNTLIYK